MKEQNSIEKLSPTEKDVFITWLRNRKANLMTCPACHRQEWIVGDHFVFSPVPAKTITVFKEATYVYFMLICENCGNTQFFNAKKIHPPRIK